MARTVDMEKLEGGKVVGADSVEIVIEMPDGQHHIVSHKAHQGESWFELWSPEWGNENG